jgi:N6-adenosine-specific RNA methylase IME4
VEVHAHTHTQGTYPRMQIEIDDEFKSLIPPLRADERRQLEANLVSDGCRDPLVVWHPIPVDGEHKCYGDGGCELQAGDGVWTCETCGHNPLPMAAVLLDGHNRYEICTRLGIEFDVDEVAGIESRDDAILWVVNNQLGRRNITDFVRAELALRAKPVIEARAKANQKGGQGGVLLLANLPEAIDTRAEIASMSGVSERNISKVERIKETASPELLAAVRAGDVSINAAADIATLPAERQAKAVEDGSALSVAKEVRAQKAEDRRAERVAKIVEISAGNEALGTLERYPVIYCDPPWRYEHIETESRAIENQYPTMTLDDICALPVSEIATDDCVLFMWATSPKLAEAMQVIEAWGFTYRTCAVWDKEVIGMGYYFRQQHELLLVATKGSPVTPLPAARPSSVIRAKREQHSKKPVVVYELIDAMYGEMPRIELFCRTPQPGWSVWGNQSEAA